MGRAGLAPANVRKGSRAGALVMTCAIALVAFGAGAADARPASVRGEVRGRGVMVGDCSGVASSVRLTAIAEVHAQYLGNGLAEWTTCIEHFGGTFLNVGPQEFEYTTGGGTLSGTVTDASLQHVIGGQCIPPNLIGQWTVRVTVENLSGTGKFAKASGGQLDLEYEWARADGGTCVELPGFPARDMTLFGTLTGSLA